MISVVNKAKLKLNIDELCFVKVNEDDVAFVNMDQLFRSKNDD